MASPLLMPALSPTMTEGNLVKWYKKQGDPVKAGEILAEIETDKATMEVEAVDEGTLGAILIPAGTQGVAVNQTIGILLEAGEGEAELTAALTSAPSASGPASQAPSAPGGDPIKAPEVLAAKENSDSSPAETSRVHASPLARRIAARDGIDLTQLKGSGPRGRIVKQDVLEAAHQSPTQAQRPAFLRDLESPETPFYDTPVSSMRKIIARRLTESKQTVPHFYLTGEIQIDALLEARVQLNQERDQKISINDLVIFATARALAAHPAMNVAWQGDTLRCFERVDLAMAVSLEDGLITPILRGACTKGLDALSLEAKSLIVKARASKLKPEEFQGGTFSVSNLGMFGVDHFAAIVNPPHAGILAIGAAVQKPVVREGAIVVGTCLTLTLSVDHRAVDGVVGAQFLKTLQGFLTHPVRMLL